jgi:hypothetical protein
MSNFNYDSFENFMNRGIPESERIFRNPERSTVRMTVDEALKQMEELGVYNFWGLFVPRAPETYAELQEMVDATRNESCEISNEIDKVMKLIGTSEDPDGIVARLPFDDRDNSLMFMLPIDQEPV